VASERVMGKSQARLRFAVRQIAMRIS
jgi:hypothetical protein